MNKSKYILLAVLLVLGGVSAVLAEPAMMIKEPIFDFGYVPQNSTISHIYWLYSSGTDSLEITNIRPGCGCTKAPLEKDIIAPGDSTQLEIIYSTRLYSGPQSKRPAISSNEGDFKKYIQFTANVYKEPAGTKPITIDPHKFDISQYGEKPRKKLRFEITNVSDEELKLEVVDYPESMLKLDFPDKIKAGETEEGKLEVKDFFTNIEFEKSITIELNDKEKTRFTIPVKRLIRRVGG